MSAKFDEEAHNGSVFIVFTSLFPYMSIVTSLVIVNMSAKFDEEEHYGSVFIVFTRSKRDGNTHARTEPQQRYYIPSATRCAGIIIEEDENVIPNNSNKMKPKGML